MHPYYGDQFLYYDPNKRQRRQAAGLVVSSFLPGGNNNTPGGGGKKSTAQPRPKLHIAPRGIGPIADPNKNDVLSGRGGRINAHEGNVQFRDVVNGHKKVYLAKTTKKLEKAHIAAKIVEQIRTMDPPGRFLKEDSGTGLWWDIGDAKAIKKVGQALREDAQEVRKDDDEEDASSPAAPADKKKAPSRSPAAAAAAAHSPSSRDMPPPGTKPGPKYSSQQVAQKIYNMPANLYKGAKQTVTLSEQALKAMTAQQPPSNVAFGRNFTPTEISGASMSTISGMSGATSANMDTGSNVYGTTGSALSMNSWGVGSLGMGSVGSMRSSNLTGGSTSRHGKQRHSTQHRGADPRYNKFAPRVRSGGNRTSSGGTRGSSGGNSDVVVSDLTFNFMNANGIQRSPSFGELSTATGNNQVMSDDSFVALVTEQKAVDDAVAQQRAVDEALLAAGGGSGGLTNSDQWSRITANDMRMSSGRSGSSMSMGQQQQQQQPAMMPTINDSMSVASGRSMMSASIMSAGDDASWAMQQSFNRQQQLQLQQQQLQLQQQQQQLQQQQQPQRQRNDPWDNQTMISDISDTVLALDLAGPRDS
eukprot:CAMPEP_0194068710 /NCGR_PEP_ID=MMETSP0009_2-20130614/87242_1 /TAXON_ID=210454 /ORGANISM="Grammatophora oceanica, Strain CCMP 410" /LENGTH=585 /DNA_ID=CAMNT_0038721833 /DNA_START=148 /DNA_END=1905 /DNA_ORIENTATION=-